MQGPVFLSEELAVYCAKAEHDEELFQLLVLHSKDGIAFFEAACDDEQWAGEHSQLLRRLFRWGAKQYYLGKIPSYLAQKMARVIQKHSALLQPYLYFRPAPFFNATLMVDKQPIRVNTLLFGTASPFFFHLFRQAFESFRDRATLSKVPIPLFRILEEHIIKGRVNDLWRHEYEEVLSLMKLSKRLELPLLVKECAEVLRRYFDRDHILSMILEAQQGFFEEWKHAGYEFFNKLGYGLKFVEGRPEDLKVEFLDFKDDTIRLFRPLAAAVTHLAFGGNLSASDWFGKVIAACPKLVGVDLSGSKSYEQQDKFLPYDLLDLNLSACPWLNSQNLREFTLQCLDIKTLSLAGNVQLNYLSWGLLRELDSLISLDLSLCHQLTDEDLKLVCRACPHLIEIKLEECKGFSDLGVLELVQTCRQLAVLNISRCYTLTDRTLQYIASYTEALSHLSLERCTELSDKALIDLVRSCTSLSYLNVKYCDFSLKILSDIRNNYPLIQIVD